MLNPLEKQNVKYCIPTELRDEQIKLSIKRFEKRVIPNPETSLEPVAIVCFGPSLQKTWEEIKKFKVIITCSGAHKFLIEKGIIPTYHIECDPRKHKTSLLGEPHKDVKYYIASCCHPSYFDKLKGFDVSLWHIFQTEEESFFTIPRGEWCMTGGSSVGLRSLTMARFLGYKNLHIFGMDGSFENDNSHADTHPNSQISLREDCEYNGKKFYTTSAVMECARQTFHELDELEDVECIFYGEGLVQEMSKDYVRTKTDKPKMIGFKRPKLFSDEYLQLLKDTFDDYPEYAMRGDRHKTFILDIYDAIDGKSILDYGCGRGYLAKSLDFPIWEYDPAIVGKDTPPRPADLVVCTDVLEHIEPENLHFVIDDIRRCTKKMAFLSICTVPASKILRDGRNAHLIVEKADWWKPIIERYFFINNEWEDKKQVYYNCLLVPRVELNGYKYKTL